MSMISCEAGRPAGLQKRKQRIHILRPGGPAGGEPHYGMILIHLIPQVKVHLLPQLPDLRIWQYDKLLVGGGIQIKGIPFLGKPGL